TRATPSCVVPRRCSARARRVRCARPTVRGPDAMAWWNNLPVMVQGALLSTLWVIAVTVVLILCVAYLTLWERKVIGWMQVRKGPNRVRIFGLLPGWGQPFADVVKLVIKEVVVPAQSNGVLFRLAPAITLIPAFAIWAVIPIAPGFAIAKIDAGLL